MKERLFRNHKGIVSNYFLLVLLFCSSLMILISAADQSRLKTMMNMKEAQEYLIEEMTVISDFKCRLLNNQIDEGYIDINMISYEIEMNEVDAYLNILGEKQETLYVSFDKESRKIVDYEAIRNGIEVN